jgi:Xaa-Pro aminopeptidase
VTTIEKGIYAARRAKVAARLVEDGMGAALFEDAEGRRDLGLRYLSGQPGDALLVIGADGRSALIAWDVNLAALVASADEVYAYTDFNRMPVRALAAALERLGVKKGSSVELPSTFAYPRYVDFVEALSDYDLVCREGGVDETVRDSRAVKDGAELAIYRKAADITNGVIDEIEAGVRSGALASELDVALFIERAARSAGCEGTGFETLAAGPSRSWGIHAFPPFGAGPFATEGMSILDFGLKYEGYTTDVTMSFVRGKLGERREKMIELVERVHDETIAMMGPGVASRSVADRADAIFAEAGFAMPHALGHGVGLEAHEAPSMRSREDCVALFEPGQIVTSEPGLYDPELGGLRWEDDILITEGGREVITKSRIVRL